MREFALVPGLVKIMNKDDWIKVFHACSSLPDYRELKYADYFLTKDSHIRGGKIYYNKVALPAGGYEYKVVSHEQLTPEQTNAGGDFELAGYDFVAHALRSASDGIYEVNCRIEKFQKGVAYFIHRPGGSPTRVTDGIAEGGDVYTWMCDTKNITSTGCTRLYKKTIVRTEQRGSTTIEVMSGPTYYNIDYSRGTLTAITSLSDDSYVNSAIYSPTVDVVFIKGHVYYRKSGTNNYTLMTGWKAGDRISDVNTVYNRGADIWVDNPGVVGEKTHGSNFYERTGRRFPYENFMAVVTEASNDYIRGGLYKCKRTKYLLTEDSFRNWDKSYYEYHADTNTYVERDSGSNAMYRVPDGNSFIQKPHTDTFVEGSVYYKTLEGTELLHPVAVASVTPGSTWSASDVYFQKVSDDPVQYKRLRQDTDYTIGDSVTASDVYSVSTADYNDNGFVVGAFISDFVVDNIEYPGVRNRPMYWRNGWEFTEIENAYGVTTDTKFDFESKQYFCYRGYGYEFDEINADNVFSVHPDNVFGYETWTKENFGFIGYRRLIEGKDYTVGEPISGTLYVADPDSDTSIDTTTAATGVFLSGTKYWKRDTDLVTDSRPTLPVTTVSSNYHKYDSSAKRVSSDAIQIEFRFIGATANAVSVDLSNCYIPYETVPEYYYMSDKDNASWAAKFTQFPVSKVDGEEGYDYYGTVIRGQSETIYTKSADGTIPTAVDVCVQFQQGLTYTDEGVDLLDRDGMAMPTNPTIYTTSRAGENMLNDEYYEEATGVYTWDHFYLDKNISSSAVYDVVAYYDSDKIYLSWKDPELMINATDVTAGVDAWYKTTVDFIDAGGTSHQMYVETSKNEFGFSFLTWNCTSDRAEGNCTIDSSAAATGTFRITAVSRTGMVSPDKIVKAAPIVDKHSTDKVFMNIMSDTALPGLVYYSSLTDEEIYNVEPYVTTLSNFYVKYQKGIAVYEFDKVSGVYRPVDMTGLEGTRIDTSTTAKYIRAYAKPEITYAELARNGDLKRLCTVGDVVTFPVPAQVEATVDATGVVTVSNKGTANAACRIVDFDHANVVRDYEVGYEPVDGATTVAEGVDYFLRINTTTIACTAADNYVYAKIYGLTEGVALNTVFGSAVVYKHRSDGVPHYQFYTRTANAESKGFVYTALDYTSDTWKSIVDDRNNSIFYKDNAYTGIDASGADITAYGEYDDGAQGNVTLAYTEHTLKDMTYVLHPDGEDTYWNEDTCAARKLLDAVAGLVSVENLGIKRCLNTVCSVSTTLSASSTFVGSKVMCRTKDYFWLPSASQIGVNQLMLKTSSNTAIVTIPEENGLLDAFDAGSNTRFTVNRDVRWTRSIPLCDATLPSWVSSAFADASYSAVAVDGSSTSAASEKAVLREAASLTNAAYAYAFFTLG